MGCAGVKEVLQNCLLIKLKITGAGVQPAPRENPAFTYIRLIPAANPDGDETPWPPQVFILPIIFSRKPGTLIYNFLVEMQPLKQTTF